MAYITYFDLLGTRGFCDNRDTYFKNITSFEKAVKENAWLMKDFGHVGVFSDCAYAECSDLQYLLDFLVQVRNRLMSEKLFFNAVVKEGSIGAESIDLHDKTLAFGISFKRNDIADLYICQTGFKGIGIYIDPKIYEEVERNTDFEMNDSVYVSHRSANDYFPVAYKDISFCNIDFSPRLLEQMVEVVIREMYSSYLKSPKFGSYYISLIVNILRSFTNGLDWDLSEHIFKNSPTAFKTVLYMIKDCYDDISDLHGIEYLALILLDIVYNSTDLNNTQKKDITMNFTKFDCVKKNYLHCLNNIPLELFSTDDRGDEKNRKQYIDFCKEEISKSFFDNILEKEKQA